MKKKFKYLPLYKKWAETGKIEHSNPKSPPNGLCGSVVAKRKHFKLVRATQDEIMELAGGNSYWASDFTVDEYFNLGDRRVDVVGSVFSPTRQNLLLIMAYLNGEFKTKK